LDHNQNTYPVIKPRHNLFATRDRKQERAATITATFLTNTMKRFVVFIVLLGLLIMGEYYFLTEVITQKRGWVIVASLLVSVICLYFLIRFYKRSIISSRPTGS
jgi:uncharacterized BrkB/YihY/UPF0761 family membrane protein